MLVQMLPEQVSEEWDFYAPIISEALPPNIAFSFKGMSNVLRAILCEELIVWNFYNETDELQFILTTTVVEDKVSYVSSLLIYSFTSVGHVRKSHMLHVVDRLQKYAKSQKCGSVIAYSSQERVSEFLGSIGGDISNRIIIMEV